MGVEKGMTASQPLQLGFFARCDGVGDPRRIYEETLELFVAADQLGFDMGWVAEHHFKESGGRLPSLFPFLAIAAERTRHIRLGTALVVLPFTHPLRVAEDAAVVDLLSNGRLELGMGSGSDNHAFELFGHEMKDRHALTTNAVETLRRAFRGDVLGEGGQRLQPPAPTLANRLWQSAVSQVGAQHVARQGMGVIVPWSGAGNATRSYENQLPIIHSYIQQYLEHRAGPPEGMRIAISRSVYPAADKQSALAELRGEIENYNAQAIREGKLPAGLSLDELCQRMNIAAGHPDEVVEFLLADKTLPYATLLMVQFKPMGLPLARKIEMFEQIATKIAPALGWHPHQSHNQSRNQPDAALSF